MRKVSKIIKNHVSIQQKIDKTKLKLKTLPIELYRILEKYEKKFSNIYNIGKKRTEEHMDRYLYDRYTCCKNIDYYRLVACRHTNIDTLEIVNCDIFDFKYLANSNLRCLKLKQVKCIMLTKYRFCIKKLHIENSNIKIEDLKYIASIQGLYKLKIKNCNFIDSKNICNDFYRVYNFIKNIRCALFYDKNLDIKHFQQYIINDYDVLKLGNTACKFEYVRSSTIKNFLLMKNTIELYKYCVSKNDFLSLTINSENDLTEVMKECYNYEEMNELNLEGCSFVDSDFLHFICKFSKLKHINLANTHISTQSILAIIDKFVKTLQYLNIANVPISRFVLDYAEEKLKNCTIIYKNNIKKHINTDQILK